ncbi:MAG: hypothetical protein IKD68_02130 [Solobacterium sp.]|nr:hypothetical protein [Solobacterium sp.]
MAIFSLITAFVSGVIVSLFSGFPGILPILLFAFLLVVNCECVAANACVEDQNSMLFMAVISSALVVLLFCVLVSSCINNYLCDIGLLDPEKLHPLVPVLTFAAVIVMYRLLYQRAKKNKLIVQKYGTKLMKAIEERTYHPTLHRIRRMMIKEGTLTEKLKDDED